MVTQDPGTSAQSGKAKCESIDDLLKKVTDQLNEFEALKLPALKAELDAFKKKLDSTIKDYKDKYPALRDKWCSQQQVIETLGASLKCAIPEWEKWIEECICKELQELRWKEERIRDRKRCCYGPRQRASEEANAHYTAAKARLDALTANAAGIAALQADNDKLIKDITGFLSGDKVLALYAYFFKLLPNHKQLTPKEISSECQSYGEDDQPHKLCPCDKPRDPETGACTPPKEEPPKKQHPRRVPWLIAPDGYKDALECAWGDYHKAKDSAAKLEAAFKAAPDDLAGLEKELAEAKKTSDQRINDCLKKHMPADKCCKQPPTTTSAE